MRITLFYENTGEELTFGVTLNDSHEIVIRDKFGKLFLDVYLLENVEQWEKLLIACPEYFESPETEFEITTEQAISLVEEFGNRPEFIKYWTNVLQEYKNPSFLAA